MSSDTLPNASEPPLAREDRHQPDDLGVKSSRSKLTRRVKAETDFGAKDNTSIESLKDQGVQDMSVDEVYQDALMRFGIKI